MNPMKKCLEGILKSKEDDAQSENERRWRPLFHLSPLTGWLNDPNGLCYFKGRYHAYFQYSPFEVEGGLKFWGHSTSLDLINWHYEGCVLYPDSHMDCHGVYSGSALIEEDIQYFYYTGNRKEEGEHDYVNTGRVSSVVLVTSEDGERMGEKRLLLDNEDYPEDVSCHVRDPKVWKEDDRYYMVLGARTKAGVGQALLYEGRSPYDWHLKQRLCKDGDFGYMWECPDVFELGEKRFLLVCPQGMERQGTQYQNRYQTGYFTLTGSLKQGFVLSDMTELDYGFDFYAPQTFTEPSGRRILIGWMGMPDAVEHGNPTVEDGWNQILTLPRELFVRNGRLCQRPVAELEARWSGKREFKGFLCLPDMSCYQVELEQQTLSEDAKIFIGDLELYYQSKERLFTLCFLGSSGQGRKERSCRVEELRKLTIIVDTSSVEVFLNDGETVLTTRFYPQDSTHELSVRCDRSRIVVKY